MRVLGLDVGPAWPPADPAPVVHTLVLLDGEGRVGRVQHAASLPAVAAEVGRLCGGEPFVLAVDVPVVAPTKPQRARRVDLLARRRLGVRLTSGRRAREAAEPAAVAGEGLLAALAAAGQPCLPYPDRDRRRSGLAETHPALILKTLLWERSPLSAVDQGPREELFRAYAAPAYRSSPPRSAREWAERAAALDLVLGALGSPSGFDVAPARDSLSRAGSASDVERAAALLDATLCAATARRYLESPESCLFLGDVESGYLILPADAFVRRLALSGRPRAAPRLFPRDSLRRTLGRHAQLRPVELLSVPGQPQRTEASFREMPHYEFDNRDEMLWWKHCRHLAGPALPTEGLAEMVVSLGQDDPASLVLRRSRHRTLSFRFEPPAAWRERVATRDGKTYAFRVLRAVYETLPAED